MMRRRGMRLRLWKGGWVGNDGDQEMVGVGAGELVRE